jgi:hypothetical protein
MVDLQRIICPQWNAVRGWMQDERENSDGMLRQPLSQMKILHAGFRLEFYSFGFDADWNRFR